MSCSRPNRTTARRATCDANSMKRGIEDLQLRIAAKRGGRRPQLPRGTRSRALENPSPKARRLLRQPAYLLLPRRPPRRYRRAFLLGAKQGGDVCAKFRPGRGSRQREDVDDAPAAARGAYGVDEACALLGVSRDTIERAVKAARLKSGKGLGRRLIDAESLRAMYDDTSEGIAAEHNSPRAAGCADDALGQLCDGQTVAVDEGAAPVMQRTGNRPVSAA